MKWLCLLFLIGCAQVASLNMRKHQFGILPTKIIWFQIAGFEEEQLAMLRFQHSGEKNSAFENSICVGKTWSYNLFELRPQAQATFLSQITGKKNIKLTCDDAELRPIWSYLSSSGYKTAVLESGANPNEGLLAFNKCGEKGLVFLSNLHYWLRQGPPGNADTYHPSGEINVKPNTLFYNNTCQGNNCYSTISEDVKAIHEAFSRSAHKHLFLIRDFSYLHAIEKKNFKKARQILTDLERAYAEALSLARESGDYLILLSTADSKYVYMPTQGKKWHQFEKNQDAALVTRSKLTNLVLATGSRAENFCGIYDDNQVMERILSGPKQQGLEFKFINPFK